MSLAKIARKCSELQKKDRPDHSLDVLQGLIRLKNLGLKNGTERMAICRARLKQEPEVIDLALLPSQVSR